MNYTLTSTIGIDAAVLKTQEKLYELLSNRWKGKAIEGFGRVHTVDDCPKWFNTKSGDYDDVYLNDKVDANFSFITNPVSDTEDGYAFENSAKVVVITNLESLFNDGDGRQDERAHRDVIESLRVVQRLGWINITGIQTTIEEVFRGYNQDMIKFDDMQPYHIFAVAFDLFYNVKDKC